MKNKILKVIQVIYDILSLGFIVFVIVAMAVTPKSEVNRSDNEVVEKKARDNYYLQGDYCMFGISDFCTADVLKKYPSFFNLSTADDSTMTMFEWVEGTRLIQYNLIDFSSADFGLSNNGTENVTRIVFTLNHSYSNLRQYTLLFEYNRPYASSWYYQLDFDVIYDNVGGIFIVAVDHAHITTNLGNVFFIVSTNSSAISTCSPYLSTETARNEGFQEGFKEGKKEGTQEGLTQAKNPNSETYQYIYDLGKQEGIVEGMRGTESNAFIVIGQAFSAVGSIFSVEVLPNLPLWVLVFTPLIIVVVIVVVKLIKG